MDFEVECKCHFFLTLYRKSACDGIGGVLKRRIAKASLQKPFKNQIFTPQNMHLFCKETFGEKTIFLFF